MMLTIFKLQFFLGAERRFFNSSRSEFFRAVD